MPEEIGVSMAAEGAAEAAEAQNEGLGAAESTESSQGSEVDGGGQETQGQPTEKGGPQPKARQVIDKYLKSDEYKQLKEANPQLAKAINSAHHVLIQTDAMLQPFGGLPGLKKIVESLDMAGGLEALPQMAERLQEYDSVDAGLESGDPQVVMGVIEQFPSLMNGQAVPMVLGKYAQANPQGFDQLKAELLTNEIYQRGHVFDYLVDAVKSLPSTEETKEARALLLEIYKWFEKRKEAAGKQPEAAKPAEMSQKEKELADREENVAMDKGNVQVQAHAYPKYIQEAAKLGLKLEGKDLEEFKGFVDANIQEKCAQDPNFKRLFLPLLKNRDSEGLAKLAKQYVDKFVVKAVSEVYEERYKGRGRFANIKQQIVKKPPVAGKPSSQPNGNKSQALARVPKIGNGPGDINKRLTTQKMFSQGQAYLNNGQFVTFKRA